MMSPLDRQLWRLFHQDIGVWPLLAGYLPIVVLLGIAVWFAAERRSRSSWARIPSTKNVVGDGPYREAPIVTFHSRAPAVVRWTGLAGIVVGMFGFVWLVLLLYELAGELSAPWALALDGALSIVAMSCVASAIALLLGRVSFTASNMLVVRLVAVLAFATSVGHVLHLFDGLRIEVHAIKWRETTTLGDFLRSGFSVVAGGHFGVTWRLVLRAASVFGLLSSGYFALWSVIAQRATPSPRSAGPSVERRQAT